MGRLRRAPIQWRPVAMLSSFAASLRLLGEITPFLGGFQPSIFLVWAFH